MGGPPLGRKSASSQVRMEAIKYINIYLSQKIPVVFRICEVGEMDGHEWFCQGIL